MKTFKFVHEDNIKKTIMFDDILKKDVPHITAENRHLFTNCPIQYDTSTGKCLIYSDEEIAGLKVVGNNQSPSKSRCVKEEIDVLPTLEVN